LKRLFASLWAGGAALYKKAMRKPKNYLIKPDPLDPRLTERVTGVDQTGAKVETAVIVERALTIFLNSQEIVTAMTIGDYPE
jgi:FdhD protein